jgi:hypothetical protein
MKKLLKRIKYEILLSKNEKLMLKVGALTILESQKNRNFRRSIFRTSFGDEFVKLLK